MPPQEERKRKPIARKPRRVMRAARPDRTARERPAAPKRAPARPKRSVRPATRGVTPPTGRGPSRRMAPTARAKPARPTHTRAAGLTKRGQRGMTGPGSLPIRVRARARAQAPAKMAPSRAPSRRLKPMELVPKIGRTAKRRPPVSPSGRHPGSGRTQVPPRSKRRKGKTILDRGLIRRGISRLRRQ